VERPTGSSPWQGDGANHRGWLLERPTFMIGWRRGVDGGIKVKAFSLLDESWLPARLVDGRIKELGLLDIFRHSHQVVALAETAPPNLVAQYRLLLAILHRALTRAFPDGWKDKDRARWYREG